ncbi:hypothetical protein V2J09_024088 [Rumex salicifolius]
MEGEDWSSFNGVFVNEEADFMAQLFPTNVSLATNNLVAESSGLACWSNDLNMATGSIYSSKYNLYSNFSQESCYSGASCITNYPTSTNDNYHYISDNNNTNDNINTHSFLAPNDNNATFEESGEVEHLMSSEFADKENDYPNAPSKVKRNGGKSKKRQRVNSVEDGNNGGLKRQSSSYCSSEDESNLSLELNNGVTSSTARNSNGKTRACRGSATDPQSLYARKRRERINERLRILQGLVPNGTKVDISTMLEEAVEYVKFLQLQIKLLSSDDLWMYAPIAYNGMDIGLDLKINASK